MVRISMQLQDTNHLIICFRISFLYKFFSIGYRLAIKENDAGVFELAQVFREGIIAEYLVKHPEGFCDLGNSTPAVCQVPGVLPPGSVRIV